MSSRSWGVPFRFRCPLAHAVSLSAARCPLAHVASLSAARCPLAHAVFLSAARCPLAHVVRPVGGLRQRLAGGESQDQRIRASLHRHVSRRPDVEYSATGKPSLVCLVLTTNNLYYNYPYGHCLSLPHLCLWRLFLVFTDRVLGRSLCEMSLNVPLDILSLL